MNAHVCVRCVWGSVGFRWVELDEQSALSVMELEAEREQVLLDRAERQRRRDEIAAKRQKEVPPLPRLEISHAPNLFPPPLENS